MNKGFIFLIFVVLFGSLSPQVSGQAPRNQNQPLTKVSNPKDAIRVAPADLPASTQRAAEAVKSYSEGMKLVEQSKFEKAAESFKHAVEMDPEFADAYSALGRTYFKMKNWQQAIYNLRRAADLHSKQTSVQNRRYQQLLTQTQEDSESVAKANSPNPTATQSKPPQIVDAGFKDSRPEPNTTARTERRQEAGTTTKAASPALQNKPQATNQATNVATGNVKTVLPEPRPSSVAERHQVTVTPVKLNASGGENKSPVTNPNTTGVKLSQPNTTSAPRQQNNVTKTTVAIPEGKTPLAFSSNAIGVKAVSDATTVPRTELKDTRTPTKLVFSTTETKQQAVRLSAAIIKTIRPFPKSIELPQQPITTTKIAASVPETKPPAITNARGLGNLRPETGLVDAAGAAPQLKSGGEQKEETVPPNAIPPAPRETTSVSPIPTKAVSDDVALTKTYRVGANDVLDIRLNDSQLAKSTLFTVTSSGLLEYPMIDEPLPVTGLTVEEISAKLEGELKKRAVVENPSVTVGVRDYASHTVLVSGLVKDAGTKILRREAVPLYVVVADAQPLPEAARVTVVRNEQHQMFEIDLTQSAEMNLLVHPSDVITLQPNVTQFFYIGGEVKNPGEKTFRRGLTLTQAILTAGGVTQKSKVAQVGRDDGRGYLVETAYNLVEIASGKAADPLLKPGDRIMIVR
jgi:protein involved in polysaccharide export with SLBB domain